MDEIGYAVDDWEGEIESHDIGLTPERDLGDDRFMQLFSVCGSRQANGVQQQALPRRSPVLSCAYPIPPDVVLYL